MAVSHLISSILLRETMRLVSLNKQVGIYSAHLPASKWLDCCLDEYSIEVLWPRIKAKYMNLPDNPDKEFNWGPITGKSCHNENGIFIEVEKKAA